MDLFELMEEADALEASDLYLIAGAIPAIALNGRLLVPKASGGLRLTPRQSVEFARKIMNPEQWDELLVKRELNLAYMMKGKMRFRVNVLWQRGTVGMVLRRVVEDIPTMRRLGLPPVLRNVALSDRGIVFVTGATGSGKSTTMAAMIDYRNHLLSGHIVTIEDPIEFIHRHRRSIVTQREVGIDTKSYEEALRNTLRQAPNVISIGEIRDSDTVRFALHAAETGHLVFATLHSTNTVQTIKRILNFFPIDVHDRVLIQLAHNLTAIISQRLLRGRQGGRVCAAEVLMNSPRVEDLIVRGEPDRLREHLTLEHDDGTQSFDLALYRLAKRGLITEENAVQHANSSNDLHLKFRGMGVRPASSWERLEDPWTQIQDDFGYPADYVVPPEQVDGTGIYTNEGVPTPEPPPLSFAASASGKAAPMGAPARVAVADDDPLPGSDDAVATGPRPSVAERYREILERASREVARPTLTPPVREDIDSDLSELD
ncbi:MAG: PilT/PilU family type 4a pilus ATPase [Candidatus Sumerlaeia bacterium]|nr:PilT/PilU family type 4a pilus ATPase [Candidatus Sumerlaeia bacterium]